MIGKKLKQIRRENELTQEEFGKKLLHTKSTISKWENDQATPDIATLKKISDLFDIDLNSLIKDIETKRKSKQLSKQIFEWSNANYSGNTNMSNLPGKILFNLTWILLALIGLGLMLLPLLISQDGYGKMELILTLIGVITLIIDTIFSAIMMKKRSKKTFTNRFNIIFELYNDKIKIISAKSKATKNIIPKNIISIDRIGENNELQIKLTLNSGKIITLFGVDSSVHKQLTIFKKGGLNEN